MSNYYANYPDLIFLFLDFSEPGLVDYQDIVFDQSKLFPEMKCIDVVRNIHECKSRNKLREDERVFW